MDVRVETRENEWMVVGTGGCLGRLVEWLKHLIAGVVRDWARTSPILPSFTTSVGELGRITGQSDSLDRLVRPPTNWSVCVPF